MSKSTYDEIPASDVRPDIMFTFVVPDINQGQIVEIAYSRGIPAGHRGVNYDAGHGDAYARKTDRSDGMVTYYRRRDIAERA